MLHAPNIDPVAIAIGPLKVHWYGLMYLVSFVGAWWLGRYRASRPNSGWKTDEVGDLVFYFAVGAIVGGRLGYVLFYNPSYYIDHPLHVLYLWTGGMSFHGGLIGTAAAFWLYGRHTARHFLQVTDFGVVMIPVGLFFGRLGNFINHELWGKVSDVPWAMVFRTGGPLPRHPSQLYEAALEGVVLLAILWWFASRPRPVGAVSGLILVLYAFFRFLVEFVRMPDAHLGYLAFDWLTMGQVLSMPMFLAGAGIMWVSYKKKKMAK